MLSWSAQEAPTLHMDLGTLVCLLAVDDLCHSENREQLFLPAAWVQISDGLHVNFYVKIVKCVPLHSMEQASLCLTRYCAKQHSLLAKRSGGRLQT